MYQEELLKSDQFYQLYVRLTFVFGDKKEFTYDEWNVIPDDYKAAALYLNFYTTILKAWRKIKQFGTIDDADAISLVTQYLCKNARIISECQSRYTCAYIYTVTYNSMVKTSSRLQLKMEQIPEISAIVEDDDPNSEDLYLFDISTVAGDRIEDEISNRQIWECISKLSEKEKDIVLTQFIRGKGLTKKNKKLIERLRKDLEVSCQFNDKIKNKIYFDSVLKRDDDVSSAVVIMPDGEQAVYYGEKAGPISDLRVIFFGASKDYIYKVSTAAELEVVDIEYYK